MRLRGLPRHPVGDDPHSIMSNAADPRRSAILTPAGTGGSIEASGDGRLQASARLASTGSGTSGAGGDGGGSAASGGAASARAPCGVGRQAFEARLHLRISRLKGGEAVLVCSLHGAALISLPGVPVVQCRVDASRHRQVVLKVKLWHQGGACIRLSAMAVVKPIAARAV